MNATFIDIINMKNNIIIFPENYACKGYNTSMGASPWKHALHEPYSSRPSIVRISQENVSFLCLSSARGNSHLLRTSE